MKNLKNVFHLILASSVVFSPSLRADGYSSEENTPTTEMQYQKEEEEENTPSPQTEEATTIEETATEPAQGTPVGQAASEGTNAAKRKQWQNIALAAGAVVVAVTALILIANNDGHHKGHHHKK